MAAKKPRRAERDKPGLKRFADMVRRCRENAGYANTRSFYQALGGREFFGCTYKAYLNVENGASLPQPRLVERLVAAFRLALHKEQAREFALSYLGLLIAHDDFFELAVQVLVGCDDAAVPAGRTQPLNEKQLRALKDAENYWCFSVLAHDKKSWRPQELAGFLSLPQAAVSKALDHLLSAGLLTRDGGAYHCPQAGKMVVPAIDDASLLTRHVEALEQGLDGRLMEHPLLLRASESEFRRYFPFFAQSLGKAAQYATTSKGSDTALFLIEAGVLKILPF